MNEARFSELVNLYFDQEIAPEAIESLRDELARCPARRREFEARYRLHQGMRVALAEGAVKGEQRRARAARQTVQVARWAALLLGSGLAACVTLAVLVLRPAFQAPPSLSSVEPLEALEPLARTDLERFVATRTAPVAADARADGRLAAWRLFNAPAAIASPPLGGTAPERVTARQAAVQRTSDTLGLPPARAPLPHSPVFELLPRSGPGAGVPQRWPSGFRASLANF